MAFYFMPVQFTSWACHFRLLRGSYQLKGQICMSFSLLLPSMFDHMQFKTLIRVLIWPILWKCVCVCVCVCVCIFVLFLVVTSASLTPWW